MVFFHFNLFNFLWEKNDMYIRKNIVKNYLLFFLIFFSRFFSFILLLCCSMASLASVSSFACIWCKPRPQFQNSNTNTAANGRLGERSLRPSNTKSGDGQALISGLWDYSTRYRKGLKCWLLQTVYERCTRKFGKWSRRKRRWPFHFVDCQKIRILTGNNDCVVNFKFF